MGEPAEASLARASRRNPEAGNSLVLAMIVMTALGTLSMLTVFSVRGGTQTVSADRFHAIALYAAESGAAAGMDFLRTNINPSTGWQTYLNTIPSGIPGNSVVSGGAGNLLSNDQNAWYEVKILNNRNDTGYASGRDDDKRVIIRSTGYGPAGAMAIVEWEIKSAAANVQRPCPNYGQKNESEDNAARNDCLGAVDTSVVGTYTP